MNSGALHHQTATGALHLLQKAQERQIDPALVQSLNRALRLLLTFNEEEAFEAKDLNILREASAEVRRILDEVDSKVEEKARLLADYYRGELNALEQWQPSHLEEADFPMK
jgi:hypothetical protein